MSRSPLLSVVPCVLLLAAGCLPSREGTVPVATPTPEAPAVPAVDPSILPPPLAADPVSEQRWALRPDSALERRAKANQIPQLPDRWALFGTLTDGPVGSVTGGVLVCDLRLPGSPWWKSRPDMQATLTLGDSEQVLVGENNRDATVVTAPIASLSTGDSLSLSVEDRDLITRNDFIDAGSVAFPGSFPLLITGAGGKLHATCRLLAPDAVATRRTEASRLMKMGLVAYESARGVDLSAQDLGYPWAQHQSAEAGLDAIAALAGWSDPELGPARERLVAAKAAQMRTLADAVQGQIPRSTPVDRAAKRPGGGSLKVIALRCGESLRAALGEQAPECALQIDGDGDGADLVFPDGRTEPLHPIEGHPDHLVPGSLRGDLHPRKAVLLRVVSGGGVQFWRMP